MSLVVVGSMAFDDVETPFGRAERIVGGAASYIALCASLFTPEIKVVSIVGADFPETFMDMLRSKGADLDGVEVRKDGKSFYWRGRYHNDMNSRDTLATELNVLGEFNPVLPENFRRADYLLLGNLSPAVQSSVIEQMAVRPKLVAMDTMNFWMDIAMDDLRKTLGMVDLLIINDEEARQLSKEYSLVKAAGVIRAMGPRYLVIKKGEHGALLFHEDGVFSAPALPLEEVFDPTGAGDSFAGGLMGYLAKTDNTSFQNMKRAIIYGSAAASYCVEKFGTERLESINSSDIDERFNKFVELAHWEKDTIEELS